MLIYQEGRGGAREALLTYSSMDALERLPLPREASFALTVNKQ